MSEPFGNDREQTPAQWAVRWHVVVVAGLMLGMAPLMHLWWYGWRGESRPILATKSYVPMPVATAASVADGTWMVAADRHLREASPQAFWLRSTWSETLYRLGAPQSSTVHFGKDAWMFGAKTLQPDVDELARRRAARLSMLGSVKAAVEAAGARLVVSLVPDKVRIYPEQAQDGAIAATHDAVYGTLLAELRELGIAAPDLATPLRLGKPFVNEPLYFARDSHWRPVGAFVAAQALAGALEALPLPTALQPRQPVTVVMEYQNERLGDLAAAAGFCSLEEGDGKTVSRPASALTRQLVESSQVYRTGVVRGGEIVRFTGEEADAEIVLAGTSFAYDGSQALRLAAGRPVHACIHDGADGLAGIREVIAKLPKLAKAKVVVWEIVERGFLEAPWREPQL